MSVYLFIYMISAGSVVYPPKGLNPGDTWRGQWTNGGAFVSEQACHKTAQHLQLTKDKYRCIDSKGEMK